MRDPKPNLRSLIERGKTLTQEAGGLSQANKTVGPNVRLGVGVLDMAIGLTGRKRLATSIGKAWLLGDLGGRYFSLTQNFDRWYSETVAELRRVSVVRKNLARSGNSSVLVKRFVKARTSRRLDAQITKAVGTLEAIVQEDLVYNDEIVDLHASRRKAAIEERRRSKEDQLLDLANVAPELGSFKLENRDQLRTQLSGHPEVARMIEGALDAFSSTGVDANRQALGSCRSALEFLVIEISGDREWRVGLSKLAKGTRKKLVSNTYAFLSGYGSHPGGAPTRKDAEYGIRMTVASCLWLQAR